MNKELLPFAECKDCEETFCWQPQKLKDKELFKVTTKLLKKLKCPKCGSQNLILKAKNMPEFN